MKLRAALLLVSILISGKSYADPMFGLTRTDPIIIRSFAFGQMFTVGSSDLLVTALGAFDAGGDGFFTATGIPVGIYRMSDEELVADTLVLSIDPLIDKFRYNTLLEPLVLLSGVSYVVVANNRGDLYNGEPGFTVNPLIDHTGYEYCATFFLTTCDPDAPEFHSGTDTVWMANFTAEAIGPGGPDPVPEPASLILLGTGLAATYARARRAKRR
jgi:hypothetical protein